MDDAWTLCKKQLHMNCHLSISGVIERLEKYIYAHTLRDISQKRA